MTIVKTIWSALAIVAVAAAWPVATAQAQGQLQRQQQLEQQQKQQQPAPDIKDRQPPAISDKDIAAYARAAREVERLNIAWLPKMEAAAKESPAAAQVTRQQALEEMMQAVEKSGLTVEKYNDIYDQTVANPDIQRRVDQLGPMNR